MSDLLLFGSGNEVPRKYILQTLRERGDRVVLIDSPDRTWASQLVTAVHQLDLRDWRAVRRVRMIYPPHDGTVRCLEVPDLAAPPWHEVQWHARPGREVALPPRGFMMRLGHVIAVADTESELASRLDAAQAHLKVELEPQAVPVVH